MVNKHVALKVLDMLCNVRFGSQFLVIILVSFSSAIIFGHIKFSANIMKLESSSYKNCNRRIYI